MMKRLAKETAYPNPTQKMAWLGALLVTLLGMAFSLNNHHILRGCYPCSTGVLLYACYFSLLHWIGDYGGRSTQLTMWRMSSLVVFFFITFSSFILRLFPIAPSNMVATALWEVRYPKEFISIWFGSALFIWMNPDGSSPLHTIGNLWWRTLIKVGAGSLLTLGIAYFFYNERVATMVGHGIGFLLISLLGWVVMRLVRGHSTDLSYLKMPQNKRDKVIFWSYQLLVMLFCGACITTNLLVVKHVTILGRPVTAALLVYVTTFLLTDVVGEVYGNAHAGMVVVAGFVSNLTLMGVVGIVTQCQNADPTNHAIFLKSFSFVVAIVIASMISYLISQLLDIHLFSWIRKRTGGRWLWLRNNIATMMSQTVDTLLFVFIAWGIWSWFPSGKSDLTWEVWESIAWHEWGYKLGLSLLDTPFVYGLVGLLRHRLKKVNMGG